ncbi:hypothetical protein HF086_002599 [Spodoptera exigua]|uniref:Amino acid transporter transmembrane domain-containing protein n=1 Tax=Spodoptera exigua TaxID=7107 RepID=A0A922SG17_SPOEX|nr:hypothetical protein HF086_002599 [Spodoptera exigua]
MLIWSAQKLYGRLQMPVLSYPDIIEATILLSPWNKFRKIARGVRYILEGTLMMHLYGSCCVFIIMMARALKELLGGLFTAPAVIVYPAIIELILDWEYPGLGRCKWRFWKCMAIVIIGLVTVFGGTYSNIVGMVHEVKVENKPNYTHGDKDDNWKYKVLRINTDVNPSLNLYDNNDFHGNPYDTKSKPLNNAIPNINANSVLPYNRSYPEPEQMTESLKNVNTNNSNVYVILRSGNETNDIVIFDSNNNSTAVLSIEKSVHITPAIEKTSKTTSLDESTIPLITDNNIVTIKPSVERESVAEDGTIDKDLSNVTITYAFVVKTDIN